MITCKPPKITPFLLNLLMLGSPCLQANDWKVMDTVGKKRGLIVHINCGDGRLIMELGKTPNSLVQGLALSDSDLQTARKTAIEAGVYGKVSVGMLDGNKLPYADNLVNVIIDSSSNKIQQSELMRVLSPLGILLTKKGNSWKETQKPWTNGIADWTHYNYNASNTGTSEDELIGPPTSIQWICGPNYSRSHETDPSISAIVSSQGRLYYIQDDGPIGITDQRIPSKWSLIARDGFSGIELWRIPMTQWGWQSWKPESIFGKDWRLFIGDRILNPSGLMRRLVANKERIYVTLGYFTAISEIDGTTGKILRSFKGTEKASEIVYRDDHLFMVIGNNTTGLLGKKDTKKLTKAKLACLELKSGNIIWEKPVASISVWSLCVDARKVFYCDGQNIVAINAGTGEEMWKSSAAGVRANLDLIRPGFSLASYRGVLLSRSATGMAGISMETGKSLWEKKIKTHWGSVNTPVQLLSAGLVWNFESTEGYDPKTGKLVRKINKPAWLISDGHHPRCYQGRNTEKFLMTNKRGIEFWDTVEGKTFMKYDWARANCRVGYVPANGTLYFTPHPCQCYMGNRLVGFNAMISRKHNLTGIATSPGDRVKGTAYNKLPTQHSTPDTRHAAEWPAYRHDSRRSGAAQCDLKDNVKVGWKTALGGKLTQPIIADGKVFVGTRDTNTVYALDATSGKLLWHFITDGGIDSPPTYYKGLLLFGSFDGWVYCLSAVTGELAWKFRAAPDERMITSYGRLASTWPVHGTILILDDTAYFHAGRNTHIDGGLFVYGVDPATGSVKHFKQLETTKEDLQKFKHGPYDMPGTREDVMVSDGTDIYIQKLALTKELKLKKLEFVASKAQQGGVRKWGAHLFATGSLLDETNFNRNYWMHAPFWSGSNNANQAPKEGQLIVFDDKTAYSIKYYYERNVYSPMHFPATKGYLFYADTIDNDPGLYNRKEGPAPIKWIPDAKHSKRGVYNKGSSGAGGTGTGFTRFKPALWMNYIPVRARGMVKANDKLVVVGPPDIMPKDDPMVAFEGRAGAELRIVDAKTGNMISEKHIEDVPVYDGVCAANGCLFMSDLNGSVHCFR